LAYVRDFEFLHLYCHQWSSSLYYSYLLQWYFSLRKELAIVISSIASSITSAASGAIPNQERLCEHLDFLQSSEIQITIWKFLLLKTVQNNGVETSKIEKWLIKSQDRQNKR
jgi:hypothetical protein